jgi:hypothetical protein
MVLLKALINSEKNTKRKAMDDLDIEIELMRGLNNTKPYDAVKQNPSIEKLGVNKVSVVRAIEALKARGMEVNPLTVAEYLAIPKSFLYADLEILENIYKYYSDPVGPDAMIQNLITENKSYKRKNAKLSKLLEETKIDLEKSYSQGFAKGASINYNPSEANLQNKESKILTQKKSRELWARGVLCLPLSEDLTQEQIKKAFRRLVSLVHPDKSGQDTEEIFHRLNEAVNILLE